MYKHKYSVPIAEGKKRMFTSIKDKIIAYHKCRYIDIYILHIKKVHNYEYIFSKICPIHKHGKIHKNSKIHKYNISIFSNIFGSIGKKQ